MNKATCPYCGCKDFNRTAMGWAETTLKSTATLAVAIGVGLFSEHHGHHLGTELLEGNSSEYKCKRCGKIFRYSAKRGTFK